jgi:hypothetical protein
LGSAILAMAGRVVKSAETCASVAGAYITNELYNKGVI